MPFLRHGSQGLQIAMVEMTEKVDGFEVNHELNLWEKSTA